MDSRALRARWEQDAPVVGPFVQMACPAAVEIFALAGYDLVNVDLEHGAYGIGMAEQLVRAADARQMASIVRVMRNEPELIAAALETGAAGVLVPHVESVQDARAVVRATRFHPDGDRGLSPTARSADYSASAGSDYYARANASVIAGALIEGAGAYADLDAIVAVDGLEVIMVAPYDLSQSLGLPGEVTHPRVIETIEDACARIRAAGKIVGTFAADPVSGADWIRRGVRFLGFDIDIQILYRAATRARTELADALGPA